MSATAQEVTTLDVVNEIKKLAAEMPDFVYVADPEHKIGSTGCSYIYGGCNKYPEHCGCIVGQALKRLGIDVAEQHEDAPASLVLRYLGLSDRVGRFVHGANTMLRHSRWISVVQRQQDKGSSWSEAVEAADDFERLLPEELTYIDTQADPGSIPGQ